MDPLIIEVAINGITTKARNPNVPLTPAEIIPDVLECLDAGAAIIHSHVENLELTGQVAANRYLESYLPILKQRPDAILYPTGVFARTVEERYAHAEILAQQGVIRMAFLDPGSTNMGIADEKGLPKLSSGLYQNNSEDTPKEMGLIYANPYNEIDYVCRLMERFGLGAGVSIFEPNFLRATIIWHRAGRLNRAFPKFYMAGEYNILDGRKTYPFWGLPPTRKGVDAYLELMEETDLPWAVTTMGGDVTATGLSRYAIENGGHIRVGLEDYGGTRTPRNVELVEEVVKLARQAGRPVATPEEAAEILNLPKAG